MNLTEDQIKKIQILVSAFSEAKYALYRNEGQDKAKSILSMVLSMTDNWDDLYEIDKELKQETDQTEYQLQVGDIVQIDPEHDQRFGGCLMVVTEPKSWGAQGYVTSPEHPKAMHAFYRCPKESMIYIGKAEWTIE